MAKHLALRARAAPLRAFTCNTSGLLCCQNFAQNQAGNTKKLSQAVVISISGSGRQVTSGFCGTSLQLLKLSANQEQLQGVWRRKAVPNVHLMIFNACILTCGSCEFLLDLLNLPLWISFHGPRIAALRPSSSATKPLGVTRAMVLSQKLHQLRSTLRGRWDWKSRETQ